ncbi:MAG: HD domain-containing protein [Haliangiales bacterium]
MTRSDGSPPSDDRARPAPGDAIDVSAALDAAVPAAARMVCERLQGAGHEALCVGGAVRDAMLGRDPGDWDVATSAAPEQVIALFRKTIPTGLQHGTVTVMARAPGAPGAPGAGEGAGRAPRLAVEVTSFRGEGAYSDGRRPDEVSFGVPLTEDLARRDFVINAMGYDPIARRLVDPFGGRDDLAAGRVRAVGEASERFAEDGLRVMRAVRFCAQLGFALDPATEAAIPAALPVLAKVSRERVRDELLKMLRVGAGRQPSRGLRIACRTGILAQVVPELALAPDPDEPRWRRLLARADADALLGDPVLGLAALLWACPPEDQAKPDRESQAITRRLKLSNAEIKRVGALLATAPTWAECATDPDRRRLLARAGRARIDDLQALWQAQAEADPARAEALRQHRERVAAIVRAGDPLHASELALSGGEVIRALGIRPGPAVGEVMAGLFAHVLERPEDNTAAALTERAAHLYRARGAGER